MSFTEDLIEQAALSIFQKLGWRYEDPANLASDGPDKRRASSGEVVLSDLLQQAARRINPHIPQETLLLALNQVQVTETPSLIEENRRIHRTLPGFISAACSRRGSTPSAACSRRHSTAYIPVGESAQGVVRFLPCFKISDLRH